MSSFLACMSGLVQFAAELTSAGFTVLNDVVFNQVIVAPSDNDETTQSILEAIQQSGRMLAGRLGMAG